MNNFFITATDTDAGKTFIACALTKALTDAGKTVAAYKPISAGCTREGELLINEDALLLTQFANSKQAINEVNPIAFIEPIAPHIAADKADKKITLVDIQQGYQQVLSVNAEFTITEGAGGWRLPLVIARNAENSKAGNNSTVNENVFLSDFAKNNQHTVILVVNMKLGCLNHALLTYEAIKADGLTCIAWVANCASAEPMSNLADNIASLTQLLPIPKIAEVSFNTSQASVTEKINQAAAAIDIKPLL